MCEQTHLSNEKIRIQRRKDFLIPRALRNKTLLKCLRLALLLNGYGS